MSWPTVELGRLTNLISSGSTPLGGARVYLDNAPVAFIRSQNVRMEGLDLSNVVYISEEIDSCMSRSRLLVNDVLLNITGASIGRVSVFRCAGLRANVNQHVCVIRPKPDILDAGYLAHQIATPSFQTKISTIQNGGTRQALTFSQIAEFAIPLPPLEEQQRVAAILDKAESIRRKREQAIELADEFLRSLFLKMFGDPVRNPKAWPVLEFGKVIQDIEAGSSVSGEQRPRNPGEKAVLKISAVTWGNFDPREAKVVTPENLPPRLVTPKRGDLLFSRANTRELVAATCIVHDDFPDLFLPDKLWRLSIAKKLATPEYVHFLLSIGSFRSQLAKIATGTSGSMLNISQAKLMSHGVPIPPIKEQQRFGRASDCVKKSIFASEQSLGVAAALQSSLTSRAFRGEL
jgi:type I restriction enzyme S subunit